MDVSTLAQDQLTSHHTTLFAAPNHLIPDPWADNSIYLIDSSWTARNICVHEVCVLYVSVLYLTEYIVNVEITQHLVELLFVNLQIGVQMTLNVGTDMYFKYSSPSNSMKR